MRIAWTVEAAAELDATLSYIADQSRSAAVPVSGCRRLPAPERQEIRERA